MPSALMYPERRIVPMPNDAAKVIDMSDNGPNRVTLIGWMSELSDSGYIRKGKRGEWVAAHVDDNEADAMAILVLKTEGQP